MPYKCPNSIESGFGRLPPPPSGTGLIYSFWGVMVSMLAAGLITQRLQVWSSPWASNKAILIFQLCVFSIRGYLQKWPLSRILDYVSSYLDDNNPVFRPNFDHGMLWGLFFFFEFLIKFKFYSLKASYLGKPILNFEKMGYNNQRLFKENHPN